MKTYKMIWEPKNDKIAWEHTFGMASDEMAIKYAEKIYNTESIRIVAMGMIVFCVETDEVVAHFRTKRLEFETVNLIK